MNGLELQKSSYKDESYIGVYTTSCTKYVEVRASSGKIKKGDTREKNDNREKEH